MKKKTAIKKKLTLSLETLRRLTTEQTKEVHGAEFNTFNTYYCTGDSVRACCAD